VIDLVLCNDPFIIHNVQVCAPFSTSDHCIVDFDVTILNDDKQTTISCRHNFRNADWDAIKYHLSTVNWYDIFSSCSCPEQYSDVFYNVIYDCLDRYVPLVCNVGALDIIEAEHVSGEGAENGAKQARKLDERRRSGGGT